MDTPVKSVVFTWIMGTCRWMNRYGQSLAKSLEEVPLESSSITRNVCFPSLVEYSWHLCVEGKSQGSTLCRASDTLRLNYSINPLTTAEPNGSPLLALKRNAVVKRRVGGFWPPERLAERKFIHPRYLTDCQCSKAKVAEILQHVILTYSEWKPLKAISVVRPCPRSPS